MHQLPKRKRPLPPRTFEAVEFGAGNAGWINHQAKRTPQRLFIAVDPAYKPRGYHDFKHVQRPKGSPLLTSSKTMEAFIDSMKERGLRTRKISIRFPPSIFVGYPLLKWEKLFRELDHILLPNGKVTITTETGNILDIVKKLAVKHKLSVRGPKKISLQTHDKSLKGKRSRIVVPKSENELFDAMMPEEQGPWTIELTRGIKKEFPEKWQRRRLAEHHN